MCSIIIGCLLSHGENRHDITGLCKRTNISTKPFCSCVMQFLATWQQHVHFSPVKLKIHLQIFQLHIFVVACIFYCDLTTASISVLFHTKYMASNELLTCRFLTSHFCISIYSIIVQFGGGFCQPALFILLIS